MSTPKTCPCGHPKSTHSKDGTAEGWVLGQCDYSGYACGCTKWGEPQDEARLAKVRKAMGLKQ